MSFSETVVPEEFFDELLASLDESDEVVEALARAAKRTNSPTKNQQLSRVEGKTLPSACSVDGQFGL